jgi:hypothetical protein
LMELLTSTKLQQRMKHAIVWHSRQNNRPKMTGTQGSTSVVIGTNFNLSATFLIFYQHVYAQLETTAQARSTLVWFRLTLDRGGQERAPTSACRI